MNSPMIADKKTMVMQWREPSPYSGYKGQSLGRVLYFVYIYCGLHYAERVTVAPVMKDPVGVHEAFNIVSYAGKRVASYAWIADTDIPVFQFEFDFDKDGSYGRRQLQNLEFPF